MKVLLQSTCCIKKNMNELIRLVLEEPIGYRYSLCYPVSDCGFHSWRKPKYHVSSNMQKVSFANMQTAKLLERLCNSTVSPEPLLFAHTKYSTRLSLRQTATDFVSSNAAWAFKTEIYTKTPFSVTWLLVISNNLYTLSKLI